METIITPVLSFILLFVGIVATTLIAILLGSKKQLKHPEFFRRAHRISGYIFVALYLFIFTIMFQKFSGDSVSMSSKDAIHAYIGIAILPLIIIKICIVYLFQRFYKSLSVYGVIVIIAVFMSVTMSAGSNMLFLAGSRYFVISHKGEMVRINLNAGRHVVNKKCVRCHSLERVYSHYKTEADWKEYVSIMRSKDPDNLSELEELQAVGFLIKNLGIDDSKMDLSVGLKIILNKCKKCHSIERVFKAKQTSGEWIKTVQKMQTFDPNLLKSSEIRQVNYYLSTVLAKQNTE